MPDIEALLRTGAHLHYTWPRKRTNAMDEPSLEDLRRRAKSGDAAAMTALAKHALRNPDKPIAPAEGVAMLMDAAGRGDAEATALRATLAGVGLGMAPSWPAALDHLQRAAELGWEAAQIQLALLASDRDLAARAERGDHDDTIWRHLRASIDIAPWATRNFPRRIAAKPLIGELAGFLSPSICDWLIARAQSGAVRARIYDPETGAHNVGDDRTNSAYEFDIVAADVLLLLIREKIAAVFGVPATFALESTNILHYAVGQQFAPHVDYFDPVKPAFAEQIATGGQRVVTFLVYLNEGYEGGETAFPLVGTIYKGRKGDAMFFMNVDQATGAPDTNTRHAGMPPTRGEKWILSQWVRGSPKPRPR